MTFYVVRDGDRGLVHMAIGEYDTITDAGDYDEMVALCKELNA